MAYELLRPLDLYSFWYSRAIAMRTAPTLLRSVPLVAIALLFLGLNPPVSVEAAVAFGIALAGAILLSSAITVLMNISLLWTISREGVANLVPAVGVILSEMIVPLPLFPNWSQPILNALPFRYIADVPYRFYLGHIPPNALGEILVLEALWMAVLILCGRALLAVARRRLVVQGG